MKKNLYPIIAITLVLLLMLSFVFEEQINMLSNWGGIILISTTSLIVFGAILLAAWDCGYLDKKDKTK